MTRSFPSPIMEAVDSAPGSVLGPWSRLSGSRGPRSSYSDELRNRKDPHEHYHPRHQRQAGDDNIITEGIRIDSLISPGQTPERRRKSMHCANDTARLVQGLLARLAQVETQLKSKNDEKPTSPIPVTSMDSGALSVGHDIFEDTLKDSLKQQEIVAEFVERCCCDFMNKDIKRTVEYAIEILQREPPQGDLTRTEDRVVDGQTTQHHVCTLQNDPIRQSEEDSGPMEVPDRMRINSQILFKFLCEIDGTIEATAGQMVMFRPYKLLVQNESRIRAELSNIESEIEQVSQDTSKVEEMIERAKHIRCLVGFMDQYVMPTVNRLKDDSAMKVQFRDLWYLFKPGDDVYMPLKSASNTVAKSPDSIEANPEVFRSRYHLLWRVTGTGGGRPSLLDPTDRHKSLKSNDFSLNCYYIDFDGRYFLPINHTFPIYPFEGERDITSLELFPVRFLKNGHERLHEFTTKGKSVFDAITQGCLPFYYSGPTVIAQPCGCPMQEQPLHQRYIESEVIVDFKNTLFNRPEWRPNAGFWKPPLVQKNELAEQRPVRYLERSKTQRLDKLRHVEYDYIYDDHVVDLEMACTFKDKEPIFGEIPSSWAFNAEMVPEKDVMLLAGRVFAFSLRTRSFVALWLWGLTPITEQTTSLNNLQLRDNSRKHTIAKLVSAHFKQSERQSNDKEYDVVRGKGKGLVFLLHGAPGVGKTSTAESIAAATGRPLFSITCGDLGLTPKEVEEALEEIFRFAQMWNCILLLDECDIFLSRRNKTDVVRNGLVSVFLRTLEFYTGVLFLTTNRVGVIDDAIKSRLTWIAYYPPLNSSQTKRIWEVNLRLLRERNSDLEIDNVDIMRFAREHFNKSRLQNCCWNGRQIQNAFKVASALAEWDVHESNTRTHPHLSEQDLRQTINVRPVLNASHFATIAQGTEAFDYYLKEATGKTEGERAFQNTERADDWPDEQEYDSQHETVQREFRYGSQGADAHIEPWNEASQIPTYARQDRYYSGSRQRNDSIDYTGRRRSSVTRTQRPHLLSPQGNGGPRKSTISLHQSERSVRSPSIDVPMPSPREQGIWTNQDDFEGSHRQPYEDKSSASEWEDSKCRRKEHEFTEDHWQQGSRYS